jgi:hypothetical protein
MRRIVFTCVSLIALSLCFSLATKAEIVPESVIGIWLFEEDKGELMDSSDKGFNGTIYGDPKQVDGKFGNALEFDGASSGVKFENPGMLVEDTMTVVFWVKGEPTAADLWLGVIDKARVNDVGWRIDAHLANVRTRIDTDAGSNQTANINDALDGEWHHLAWVLNEGERLGYKDGAVAVNKPYNHGGGFGTTGVLQFATHSLNKGRFPGAIDEVAIFNAVLDEEDIQDIMENGLENIFGPRAVSYAGKLATTWGSIRQ